MCQNQESCKINFPEKGKIKFKDHHTKIDIPIRIYSDFECFNIPCEQKTQNNTKILFQQIPCSVGYYLITPWQDEYKHCAGENAIEFFVHEMLSLEKSF